jgi:RNA polymerase sigma-70 factor (ECF subfamily)
MRRRATSRVDEELEEALRAAQAGDGEAFRLLYRDLQPRLLRYLRSLVGAEAEDVASDAWLQIARDLGTFKGDYDRFRGWASTVARHRALDHLRRAGRRPDGGVGLEALTDLVAHDDTERDALERLSTDSAIELICGLPQDQAEAVLLRVVVGLDAKEAGRVLGKRSGAVRTAAYRGLRRLAERLATPGRTEASAERAEPATGRTEPTTGRAEPTTGRAEPTTGRAESRAGRAEPTGGRAERTTGRAEPAAGRGEPTTGRAESAAGRRGSARQGSATGRGRGREEGRGEASPRRNPA